MVKPVRELTHSDLQSSQYPDSAGHREVVEGLEYDSGKITKKDS